MRNGRPRPRIFPMRTKWRIVPGWQRTKAAASGVVYIALGRISRGKTAAREGSTSGEVMPPTRPKTCHFSTITLWRHYQYPT